jgi:3-deoxy-D-manno-octulosonate 8-phosphate phosphatase (KDO 8-P phosphatase)
VTLAERARRVRLLLMDVDGVLTDGRLYHFLDPSGALVETKGLHSQDGIALVWLSENGVRTGIISGRKSEGLAVRARMLKMSFVVQDTLEKAPAFQSILREAGLRPEEAAFIGDDLTDLPVMRLCGLGVAVANARPEVKRAARLRTRRSGGEGAVREVAELILKAQGSWPAVLKRFGA